MIVYNNQAPDAVNNVGQFGATEGSIGAYKQAAEYASDAKYWALLAESKFGTIDDLVAEVERLYQQGILMKQDIEDLKKDFIDQDARLMTLIAQTNAAVSDANNAVAIINQKLIEVQNQLDILLGMSVDVTTLPPGTPATGSFNPTTGVISLGIPEGDPGKDGTVKDLDTAPTGVPELEDLGFYVDKDDNTVHKTTLENIANLIPSVRSISVNGGPVLDGEVALTINKDTVDLGNVLNVAQYSRQEIDDKFDKTTKTYQSKAEADADAQYRQVGEKVLVWEATKYEFYTVAANKTLTPVKTEGRILTVNSRSPDSSGNIDITIPTGNPSLYLGEMVMFPYDPTKNISYPGVLPADGRLVSKESALDLGPSLISGQLPVVSETEWQAGARQYFSWGKLADGVTDADSTNFINIRLPDWTGGEAIRAPDSDKDTQYKGSVQAQKPYVVTVNNQAPDEITGNVHLSRSILGAASSGANSDITSLSGLTTPLSISQGGTGAKDADGARSNFGLGSAALKDTGVSGDAVPLLNADNTWSGVQTLSTPLAVASGGTGVTSLAELFTALNIFGRVVDVKRLIASGTWTPSATAKSAFVFLQAGGGAGGGSTTPPASNASAGSGGNSGSAALLYLPTLAASYSCLVGSGGLGVAGQPGGNGGDTSLGSICSVVGGAGGNRLTSSSISNIGPTSQSDDYTQAALFRTGPSFGTAAAVFNATTTSAGHGASSSLGGGGRSANAVPGVDGSGFGSGGGGTACSTGVTQQPGGNGAGGCVLIIELS
ncbi:tail fiber protein [Escherichia phage O18-011]|uniref:Putative tail fiber n=1 Tax=Escherichia phage O18-011 TaxID=2742113 RepID=A0A6J4EFJ4_9CAUD|nr:tail fiber protein [Escherichia phage O18-011]BCG45087.1 putative tail fiber [Escherichia phage O18-011]